MSKKATTTAKANIYQIVTERIIASLRDRHNSVGKTMAGSAL